RAHLVRTAGLERFRPRTPGPARLPAGRRGAADGLAARGASRAGLPPARAGSVGRALRRAAGRRSVRSRRRDAAGDAGAVLDAAARAPPRRAAFYGHRLRQARREGIGLRVRSRSHLSLRGSGRAGVGRSEEHTSELQSLAYLVCRLLLEKKK